MNKVFIAYAILILVCCKENNVDNSATANKKSVGPASEVVVSNHSKTQSIDTQKSVVKWKGTKLMGTGKHEGMVTFKGGNMVFSNGNLIDGQFVVDMQSIYITDIPKSDPIPRKNLTDHLNKDFETNLFSTASFTITDVEKATTEIYTITGEMTIKGISRVITVQLREIKKELEYSSKFTFNRFLWNIGEDGSWLERKVVDADIGVEVEVVL